MVDEFEKAFKSGKLKEFFEGLLSSGQFKSTFKKDPTQQKTPEEIAKECGASVETIYVYLAKFGLRKSRR